MTESLRTLCHIRVELRSFQATQNCLWKKRLTPEVLLSYTLHGGENGMNIFAICFVEAFCHVNLYLGNLLLRKHWYEDVIIYGISNLADDGMGKFPERLGARTQAGISFSVMSHQVH